VVLAQFILTPEALAAEVVQEKLVVQEETVVTVLLVVLEARAEHHFKLIL
jgi:hypothetical protein